MIYITHTRLMRESESAVASRAQASASDDPFHRPCQQLVGDQPRYAGWIAGHERRMGVVARGKRRDLQITELRLVGTEQIHRAALVRYLRDNQVTGEERRRTLREFYGLLDPDSAAIAEHRNFVRAVSSQVSALDLLELCSDRFGVAMLRRYEREYGLFFAMHCDRVRALSRGRRYLLASLLPEVKAGAVDIRRQLLSGTNLPPPRLARAR